jgi:hypothetical protein
MREPSLRRFTLSDVMILVAATSAGLAANRAVLPPWPQAAGSGTSEIIRFALLALLPYLAAWTVALLIIRLRSPRPRFRRLARQPGFVACAIAALGLLICGLSWLLVTRRFLSFDPRMFLIGYTPHLCFIVVGAWLALILGGSWRAEPS